MEYLDEGAGMELVVGLILALTVSVFSTWIGFDRDRSFYPAIMVVIAAYYGLFAAQGASGQDLYIELVFIFAFIGLTIWGYKKDLWIVVGVLFAHGIFDFFHHNFIENQGVPAWWPMFCLSCDFVMAGYLACLLKSSRLTAKAAFCGD